MLGMIVKISWHHEDAGSSFDFDCSLVGHWDHGFEASDWSYPTCWG